MRTAQQIPGGVEVVVMREVGHFPMSENPQQFHRYITPILDRIATAAAATVKTISGKVGFPFRQAARFL